METKPPLSSSDNLESDKSSKDKKKSSSKYGGVPVPLFQPAEKPAEKRDSLYDSIFKSDDVKAKETVFDLKDDDKKSTIEPTRPEEPKQQQKDQIPGLEESSAEDVQELPSAEEILAKIHQKSDTETTPEATKKTSPNQDQQDQAPIPKSNAEYTTPSVHAEVPLDEGEVEVPLRAFDADEVHQRLQQGGEPLESKPPAAIPNVPEQQTESTEEPVSIPEQTPLQAGGAGYEPPKPPGGSGGGEQLPGPEGPEPEPNPEWHQPASGPELARSNPVWQTPDAITRQFGQELHPESAPLPINHAGHHEAAPQTIVQRPEHLGILAALAVGVVDWHGRHKLRKELRRQQAEQNKRLRETQRSLHNQTPRPEQPRQQRSVVERLQAKIAELTPNQPHSRQAEIKLQSPSNHQAMSEVKRTPIERQDTLPIAAMTAAAAERQSRTTEERQLQTSAWHSYEMDRKTGRVVEHPSFVYGREFKREQSKEKGRDTTPAAIAGSLAVFSATTPDEGDSHQIMPAPHIPPSSIGATMYESQINLPVIGQVQKSWLWGGLVVLIFTIVSILIIN